MFRKNKNKNKKIQKREKNPQKTTPMLMAVRLEYMALQSQEQRRPGHCLPDKVMGNSGGKGAEEYSRALDMDMWGCEQDIAPRATGGAGSTVPSQRPK
jgi:hypothetical protein